MQRGASLQTAKTGPMSRYHEIYETWRSSRASWNAERDECFAVVQRFRGALVDFLEIPADHVRFVPPEGGRPATADYSIPGASQLGDDGFWRTGLHLTFRSRDPAAPSLTVKLVLHVRHRGEQLHFKLYEHGEEVVLGETGATDLAPGLELVYRELKSWLGG